MLRCLEEFPVLGHAPANSIIRDLRILQKFTIHFLCFPPFYARQPDNEKAAQNRRVVYSERLFQLLIRLRITPLYLLYHKINNY